MIKTKKKLIHIIYALPLAFCLMTVFIIFSADILVDTTTENFVYSNIDSLPYNKIGVVLGTSRLRTNGEPNLYFTNRVKAAADLFHSGKISYILISGDRKKYYDEPRDIKKELLKYKIPENKIYADPLGVRTYDSIIRVYKLFNENKFTVISQDFHNRRAVYIARTNGIDAVGFNAEDVDSFWGFKTLFREKFARVKMFFDIFSNYQPNTSGQKISIDS